MIKHSIECDYTIKHNEEHKMNLPPPAEQVKLYQQTRTDVLLLELGYRLRKKELETELQKINLCINALTLGDDNE